MCCLDSKHTEQRVLGRTICLLVVLHGCENWFLTLREKQRLRVLENRVLRRIFGSGEGRGNKRVEKTT